MSATAPRRELEVLPVNCRFFGMNGMFGRLVPTGGNQCGLITTAHSPCKMELNGNPIDESRCPLVVQMVSAAALNKESEDAG